VAYVIKCLKNHKAPGKYQILAEFLKKGGETLWRRIHHLIKLIWTQHKMPEECRHNKNHKKQEDSLVRTCDADG